jgi:hypothetical protein
MMALPPRFTGATSLRGALEPLDRLAGALVPVRAAEWLLNALLGDPLARLFPSRRGEGTLALALAALERAPSLGAARPGRPRQIGRPAPGGVGSAALPGLALALRDMPSPPIVGSPAATGARTQLAGPSSSPGRTARRPRAVPGAAARRKAAAGPEEGSLAAFSRRVAGGAVAAATLLPRLGVAGEAAILMDVLAIAAGQGAPGRPAAAGPDADAGPRSPLPTPAHTRGEPPAAPGIAAADRPALAASAGEPDGLGGLLRLLEGAVDAAATAVEAAATSAQSQAVRAAEIAATTPIGQLGLLVRRWQGAAGEAAAAPTPWKPKPPAYTDTEAFARTLERVLTAEARRHGITVESG